MSAYSRSSSLAAYQSVAAHGGVAAADPHRLIIMLMDGALERIAAARCAMGSGEQGDKARMIHRAVAILDELRASLNFEVGGEIAANLADVYDYASRQLMKANLDSRPEPPPARGCGCRPVRHSACWYRASWPSPHSCCGP